jgi:hypothetical protein
VVKKKTIVNRVAYFTRKVKEKVSVHPAKVQPRAFKYRNQRLTLYKSLLDKEIAEYRAQR